MFLLINILRLKVTLFQGNNLRGKTLLYSNFCCKTGFVKKLVLFISKSTNFYFLYLTTFILSTPNICKTRFPYINDLCSV